MSILRSSPSGNDARAAVDVRRSGGWGGGASSASRGGPPSWCRQGRRGEVRRSSTQRSIGPISASTFPRRSTDRLSAKSEFKRQRVVGEASRYTRPQLAAPGIDIEIGQEQRSLPDCASDRQSACPIRPTTGTTLPVPAASNRQPPWSSFALVTPRDLIPKGHPIAVTALERC